MQCKGYAEQLYKADGHLVEVDALCQPSQAGIKLRAIVKITRGQEVEKHNLQNEQYETLRTSLSAPVQTMMKQVGEQSG